MVPEAQLRAFARFIPSGAEVVDDIDAARALMAHHLDAEGLDSNLAFQIEIRLAAHFSALRFEGGRITEEKVGPASSKFGGNLDSGLQATFYGQSAIALDPTGNLNSIGKNRAEIVLL